MTAPDIDGLIKALLRASDEKPAEFDPNDVFNLCRSVSDIMFEEPSLMMLYDNFHIIGDIHGHYSGLLTLFEEIGHPGNGTNYIFLGDYVDRGPKSLETVLLLFAYKVKYPTNIYLLRGNHECLPMNSIFGFLNECKDRFNNDFIFQALNRCFDYLPLAAIIHDRIFCCHGGIPKGLQTLEEIQNIKRPLIHWKFGSIVFDLLWADPAESCRGFGVNTDRKIAHFFGNDALDEFLNKHGLSLVCRANQFVQTGFELFHHQKLVTIFSALNYYENRMGLVSVTDAKTHLECVCLSLPGYNYHVIKIPVKKPVKERNSREIYERKLRAYREIAERKGSLSHDSPFMERILEESDIDEKEFG